MRHPLRAVLVLLAMLLMLGLDHGLPHRYVPDDTAVRCALGIARDLSTGDVPLLEALMPPDGRYTTYPMLLPWLDLGALGARFAVGLALGDWTGPGSFKAAIFSDPGLAWLPARIVSALFALLLPLSVYAAARSLGRRRGEAALSALLGGSSLLLLQYGHTARPWAPMLGLLAATLWLSVRLLRRRRKRDVLAAFGAAALCGSSFQVGLMALGLPPAAVLCGLLAAPTGERRGLVLGGLLGLVLAAVLVLCAGYPHLWIHADLGGAQQGAAAALEDADADLALGGQAFDLDQFSGSLAPDVLSSWLGYDPSLLLLGAAGLLLLCWQSDRRRRLAWVLLLAGPPLAISLLFTLYDGTHVRYLMPATPFLALGAGVAAARLERAGGVGRVLALALVALPLVQAARLDWLLMRADTRSVAAAALPRVLDSGRRVALDGMGSRYGPPLLPRAELLAEVASAGVWLGRMESEALAFADQGLPQHPDARQLLPIQRFWRFDSYYASDFLYDGLSVAQHREAGTTHAADGRPIEEVRLEAFLDAWRVDAFVQVDRVPDARRRAPLTDLLSRRGRLVWELSPTGSSPPLAAELPTDMGFPLTELWTYERPGPWIRLWDLSGAAH